MPKLHRLTITVLALLLALGSTGCLKKIALKKVAGILTAEGGTVFTGDNDPQLIADALPFALKTYESLLEGLPNDPDLLLTTGKAFCMYAYAFIHLPADTVADVNIDKKNRQLNRAKNMYLRARGYLFRAFEVTYPGITTHLKSDNIDSVLALTSLKDTSLLYWTGAAWMGAFTADKFDMQLAVEMPRAVACMNHLLTIHPTYGKGSVHDFFISYYGSMPESMGGSEKKARHHFKESQALSKGESAGPYVSLATSVCVAKQYADEFKSLLEKALAIDANKNVALRLTNILSQQKASWLLAHIDNYFLLESDEDSDFDTEFDQ